MQLQGKRIVLGITGGIAAYKSAFLVRLLIKAGAEVQVVMTPSAKEFITPLTLSTLSQRTVVSEFFDRRDGSWHSHVDLGIWADLMLVAPATTATLAKMAWGIADNMLLTTYLSMKAPTMVAPAMDLDMYRHPATQEALARLRGFGVVVLDSAEGFLASGLEGKGRMLEPEKIVEEVVDFFAKQNATKPLHGKRVLITAGPTYEAIDSIRFIGNHSSGKMGIALAEEAVALGATVDLVHGPISFATPSGVNAYAITSAKEMLATSEELFPKADIAIFAAAVADYRPEKAIEGKIKREVQGESLQLSLVKNPDIAATLAQNRHAGQLLVGFALEATSDLKEAKAKMKRKGLDMIVLNTIADEGAGFGTDTNKVTIISTTKPPLARPLQSKRQVASEIFEAILSREA